MCMSAVCAMSCSEDMLLSVQCATMERCLWLVIFCQRKDMSNHHKPRPVPLGKSHKEGKEPKDDCPFRASCFNHQQIPDLHPGHRTVQ